MTGRERPPRAAREQAASGFAGILVELLRRVPGAVAAAIVDGEGETVDYAGRIDAFKVRVAAAHLQLVLAQACSPGSPVRPRWIWVRAARSALWVYALPQGYAVAMLLSYRARPDLHSRALSVMEAQMVRESGWALAQAIRWYPVHVDCDGAGRPARVTYESGVHGLELIGRFEEGLGWRERGWRVRFASGVEAMLVRQRRGHWYADEMPGAGGAAAPSTSLQEER
jgi:hypothetical protein